MTAPAPTAWTEVSAPEVMATEPWVSVHMPTYNHESYLAAAIESVVSQETRFPFEVILSDDGSKDATLHIALECQRRYPDRIRVLHSERNVGPRTNTRRMRTAWRGRYVALCEGDDYWTARDKLQQQVDFLESHPDYGLVHTAYLTRIGDQVDVTPPARDPMPTGWILPEMLERNLIGSCTVCVRTLLARAYEHSPLFSKEYLMGDYPLWLYVSHHSKIAYIDQPLSVYRRIPGSMTHSTFEARKRMALSNRDVKRDAMELFAVPADVQLRALKQSNERILRSAADAGDRQLFLTEFAWCLKHNPGTACHPRYSLRWLMARLGFRALMRHRHLHPSLYRHEP